MSKITITGFTLLLLLFLGNSSGNYAAAPPRLRRPKPNSNKPLQKASLPGVVLTKAGPARFKK